MSSMALVDYPSSDEDDDDPEVTHQVEETPSLKRKRDGASDLPPLPSKFHDLYATATRVSTRDDPSLHGGRKRVTPHVEGNWPTHLYIEWYPSTTEDFTLTSLISSLQEGLSLDHAAEVHSLVTSDVGVPLPLHVSLSRSIGLSTIEKDGFVDLLGRNLRTSGIRPFSFSFTRLDWVPNFERTRWFLVLRIPKPEPDSLNKLLYLNNLIVKQYNQPPLYPKPPVQPSIITKEKAAGYRSRRTGKEYPGAVQVKVNWEDIQDASDAFHISLAWTLQSPSKELLQLTEVVAKEHLETLKGVRVEVEEMKCKVGNVVSSMPLPRSFLDVQ